MHRPRSHDPPLRHWPRHFRTQAAVSQASSNPLAAEAAALASGTRARTGVVGKWQDSEGAWKPHRHQHQDVSLTVLSGPHRGGAAVVAVDRQRRGAGEQGDHGEQKQQQQRRAGAYPTTHLDAALAAADQCDPNECYSNCYLQGFRGGNCKENKCFCTQVPPAPPVNLDAS